MVMNPLFAGAQIGAVNAAPGTVLAPGALSAAQQIRRAEQVYAPPPPESSGSVVLDQLRAIEAVVTPDAAHVAEVIDADWTRRMYLGIPTLTAPYPSVRAALRAAWIRRHGWPALRSDRVLAQIDETVREAERTLNVEIARVWEDTRFPATVQRMLAAGLLVGAAAVGIGTGIGAAAGAGFAGIGAVIGAAAGFVVGCLVALIPVAQWNVLGDWATFVDCLTVSERYLMLGAFRRLFDTNNGRDQQPPYPAWSVGHAFRTIYTSDGTLLFCLHAVLERDCFPRPARAATLAEVRAARGADYLLNVLADRSGIRDLDPVARYALAWCAAERRDDETLEGSEQWHQVHAGRGSPWVRDLIGPFARFTAGDIRRQVIATGVKDFAAPPVTPDVRARMLADEPLIAAARARAAGQVR